MTDMAVTGDPYVIIPGACYVLEADRQVTAAEAAAIKERFEGETGAKVVIIGPHLRLVREAVHS